MKRYLFEMCKCLRIPLAVLAVASLGLAGPIDFGSGAPNANQGASMTSGALTITARTSMNTAGYDPLFGGGVAGSIYWGNLGVMDDPDCPSGCIGLGVQRLSPVGGSLGISGDGGDQDEALVFTFAGGIEADTLKMTLVGLNLLDEKGKAGKEDILDLYLEWYPSNGVASDLTVLPYNISSIVNAPSVLDFATILGTTGKTLSSVAVTAQQGHFGVGGIEWGGGGPPTEVVPEPATASLLGGGLILFAWALRRRKAS